MQFVAISSPDVSGDKEYQKKDIDLLAEQTNNPPMTIEVKADSRIADTDNVCVETITNKAAYKVGWFHYTQALHIFFVDIYNEVTHCVRTEEL